MFLKTDCIEIPAAQLQHPITDIVTAAMSNCCTYMPAARRWT